MRQKPHGSCGSHVDPLVSESVKHPGAPARNVMVRPDATGSSAGGELRRRKPSRRRGGDELRRGPEGLGTTAVEPGGGALKRSGGVGTSDLVFLRVRGCGAPTTNGRGGRRGAAMRRAVTASPTERALRERNPRAAADLASPRGAREIKPSRGRETPRAEGAGPGGPERRSLRLSRWRGEKPQEGRPGPRWTGEGASA